MQTEKQLSLNELATIITAHSKTPAAKYIGLCPEALALKNTYNLTDKDIKWMLLNGREIKSYNCPACGKQLHVKAVYDGMPTYCSQKCKVNDPTYKEKIKAANIAKYGCASYFQTEDFKVKAKETNLKKYGVDNPAKSEQIKQKVEQTNLKRWGVKATSQSQVVKSKMFTTNLQKYGVATTLLNQEVKCKTISTNQAKYGVNFAIQSPIVQNKIKQTIQHRYGVKCTQNIPQIKDKSSETLFKHYQVKSPLDISKTSLARVRSQNQGSFNTIVSRITDVVPNFSQSEYTGGGYNKIYSWKCKKCGHIFNHYYANGIVPTCPKCSPYIPSLAELELKNFVSSIYTGVIAFNTRTVIAPLELDIYIPDKNIAIEFNGTYWHSEDKKGKFYHQDKSIQCSNQNIQLIHVWEYDWLNPEKQRIIKEKLRYKLCGKTLKTIAARKCKVQEISNEACKDFLSQNHIQGYVKSSVNLGLFNEAELVAVMTFVKPRFAKQYAWELARYATVLDIRVLGGAGKLLKYFERNYHPTSLISYANCSYSRIDGNNTVYKALGFEMKGLTAPNYKYVKGSTVLSRYQCQKHKLKDLLGENFDLNLTETENMFKNGAIKINDCGNTIWVKQYK
jgi:hypothetical protein